LHKVTGRKWFSGDVEMEAGCGIVPIEYKDKSLVHSVQWSAGLEWYLLVDDPWRIAMSTDHPNGGSFLAYPEIIALLMDRDRRHDVLKTLPPGVRKRTVLESLDREYTLDEIAIITRAAPAKLLGLDRKGHLGPGADADVTIYNRSSDIQRMFELPRYVIRAGEVVVENGEIRRTQNGRLFHVAPEYDQSAVTHIREWFEQCYTIQFGNYPVSDHYLTDHEVIPTARLR
jgi:formylmethanofuran dehydrogenase subunit A